jgi:hypothetical protein
MPLVPPANIVFHDPNAPRKVIEVQQFARELQDAEYGQLAGVCVPDATVRVHFDRDFLGTVYPVAIKAKAVGWFSTHLLFNRPVVTFDSIAVEEAKRRGGLAREVFYHQAKAAASFGFTQIKAKALRIREGDPRGMHNGYYAAARWGFNASLTQKVRAALPDSLKDATCLHDLMGSEDGQNIWEKEGETIDVVFDLTPGSRSWQVLGEPNAAAGEAQGLKAEK